MVLLIFISILFYIVGIACVIAISDKDEGTLVSIMFFTFSIITSISAVCNYYDNKPKAIDVYRNNTNLQITYEDSIAVDSVVVFKNKINKYE